MQNNKPGSLHDKFQDFGAAPSEQLWNSIASNLDEDKKRKGGFWWWVLGSAAVIAIVFGVYKVGYNVGVSENVSIIVNTEIPNSNSQTPTNPNKQSETSPDQNNVNQNNENITDQKNDDESQETSSNNKIDESTNFQTTISDNKNRQHSDQLEIVTIDSDLVIPEKFAIEQDRSSDKYKKFPILDISKIDNSYSEPELAFEPLVEIQNRTSTKHWEIGFNIGTLKGLDFLGHNLKPDSNLTLAAPDNLDQENTIQGTGLASYSNLAESQVNIRRPLQVEMTLTRSLSKRWNFQTGLNLGFLFSKNSYTSGNATNVRSTFLSVGIPVHFNYDLIQRQRFSVYTGVGVNYEVPLFETVKTSFTNSTLESVSTKNFTKGYMISGQLNTGFRYHINENLKLDFRPNMRYYIHQSMKGIYPALERKFWAGATVGLVWGF